MREPGSEPSGLPRRKFSRWLARVFLGLWGMGVVGVVASYLKSPARERTAAANLVPAGEESSLPPGEARFVSHGRDPFFVIRLMNGELIAVSAVCTHFRCILKWEEAARRLECPCHRGVFSPTGEVLLGLPPRPLQRFPVEVRRGEILVRL